MALPLIRATEEKVSSPQWFVLPCAAIETRRCVAIACGETTRIIEVHRVGVGIDGCPLLSGWQIQGLATERVGWKVIKLDKSSDLSLTEIPSHAPRPDYRPGAKHFIGIVAQV